MNFKKLFIIIISILLCMCCLQVYSTAHSGRTDSNGGHYDRSDGSYHYHHGYSAHSHYDMDGDGDKDCPYEFDDKTDHKVDSGSSTSVTEKDNKNNITFGDVLGAMLTALLPAIGIGLFGAYLLSYIWLLIFKEERGCLITWISLAVLFLGSYIWLIYRNLNN